MAIDQELSPGTSAPKGTEVIDNELPAYRAISPGAVVSLVLGLASVFCFTDVWFTLVAVAAVLIGLLSIRKIRRLPEILTGAAYARAGIGLALVFALSALTHDVVSKFLIERDASRFARTFTDVMKDQPINVALWYQQSPEYRLTKNPDDIAEEIKQAKSPNAVDMYREKTASLALLKSRLKNPGEHIHFSGIESKAIDGLTVYANALFEVDGPGSPEFPEKEQFALVELMKGPSAKPNDWVVREIRFPYKPASTTLAVVKPIDDGHGHGPGGH